MKKRPLSIIIISLIYFLEPVGNLIQAAYINKLPLVGANSILSHLIWSDWIVLGLFPVVAVGVFMVRKWGWYLFVGFSILLIAYNLYVYLYLVNPNYQLHTVLLFILIITVMSAVFFRKHVYAPYFNPRLRWWEVASRYKITLNTKILTDDAILNCRLQDISESGCFVDNTGELSVGDNVLLAIQCAGDEIRCTGNVVRKSNKSDNPGYGIYFQAITKETRLKIKRLVKTLESHGGRDRVGSVPSHAISPDALEEKKLFSNLVGIKSNTVS
jgi:PilZ domain-containing protein